MKKLFLICCLCTLSLILFGCAQQTEDKIDLQSMSAADVLAELIEAGFPIYEQAVLTADTDPQKLLGTPHNYTSKAEWLDRRAGSLDNNGAFIEVFYNSSDCKAHKEKFDQMSSMLSSVRYYSFQEGKVLMVIQCDLSSEHVAEYEAAFKAMAQGKLPLSHNGDTPSSKEVAAAQSVVEEYFSACKEKDSQAILKTLTPEHNIPNTFLFGEETKTFLTIDYNPEDPTREWYITSGRGSFNNVREENVIVFRASFNIEYPEGVTGAWNEGKYEDWSIILIRDDKDSPWLIDDQGW